MTLEQALAMHATEWWKTATPEQIVAFQLFESRLCMPFGDFHGAVEKVLGRPVFTHEFAFMDHLRAELKGEKPQATMEDILALIPADKRLVVLHAK